jgi:hypothetical protein
VTSDGIQQENGVLRHLCASLGWKEEMKKKAIAYNQQRYCIFHLENSKISQIMIYQNSSPHLL